MTRRTYERALIGIVLACALPPTMVVDAQRGSRVLDAMLATEAAR